MKKLLTIAIVLMALLAQAEVVINEVMSDNGGSYAAVTAKGRLDGLDGKPYSASCSTVLLPTETVGRYWAYLYFPPKAGKFGGWSGTVVPVL